MRREIEVTQEMMEAGAAILLDRYECAVSATAPRVARQIFEAMLMKARLSPAFEQAYAVALGETLMREQTVALTDPSD